MNKARGLVLIPYFGKLPNIFPFWVKTAALIRQTEWLILTDARIPCELPQNVKAKKCLFADVQTRIRQNFPYALDLKEGSVVTAGDVIGYMGHTGYSAKENVNNIETVHLHFGLQLIFDESQKEGNNEIWIDCYNLTRFLYKNRSLTEKNAETREWFRTFHMKDPSVSSSLQLNPDAPVLNNGN